MLKRIVISLTVFLAIAGLTIGVIAWSRGYRINVGQKTLTATGILSTSSSPDKASIFIDGKLISATNASLSLAPNWYSVKISKEGYQPWEKKVRVQGEVVTQIDALLLPANPSLRNLTSMGVISPVLSPLGTKVAYIVPTDEATAGGTLKPKSGVWILELRTTALGGKSEPRHIFAPSVKYDWTKASLHWSPDEKQIIAAFKKPLTTALQLITDEENIVPVDVTFSFSSLMSQWEEVRREKEKESVTSIIPKLADTLLRATDHIRLSPDETKMLYLATNSGTLSPVLSPHLIGSNSTEEVRAIERGKYYVYDIKEDKNYFLTGQKSVSGSDGPIWYSDSKHIVLVEKDTIALVDFDGTNKKSVYSGPFENNLVYSWPAGGRLVILTSINRSKTLLNLYEIDLR